MNNFPVLSSTDSLEVLRLSRNKIQNVTTAILQAYPKLRVIDLSDNYLKTVHIASRSSLRHLYLSRNKLGMNESVSLENMPFLKELTLSENFIFTFNRNLFHKLAS